MKGFIVMLLQRARDIHYNSISELYYPLLYIFGRVIWMGLLGLWYSGVNRNMYTP
jgi:hypothetical protein